MGGLGGGREVGYGGFPLPLLDADPAEADGAVAAAGAGPVAAGEGAQVFGAEESGVCFPLLDEPLVQAELDGDLDAGHVALAKVEGGDPRFVVGELDARVLAGDGPRDGDVVDGLGAELVFGGGRDVEEAGAAGAASLKAG